MVLYVAIWALGLEAVPALYQRLGGLKGLAQQLRRLSPGQAGASKAVAG